jgi:hypothetical protein
MVKSKTLTIAVPMVDVGRTVRPAMWSATTRPQGGAAVEGVGLLGGVADRVDREVARAVELVDRDAAARTHRQAGVAGQ